MVEAANCWCKVVRDWVVMVAAEVVKVVHAGFSVRGCAITILGKVGAGDYG